MFTINYMQYWNKDTLAHLLAKVSTTNTLFFGFVEVIPSQAMIFVCGVQDKIHLYRLRLIINLLINEANNARDKVMQACTMWGMGVVPLLLVAISNKLMLFYKRLYKRQGKKTCIYIIMYLFICLFIYYLIRTLFEILYLQCLVLYLSYSVILQKIGAQDWFTSYSFVFTACVVVLLLFFKIVTNQSVDPAFSARSMRFPLDGDSTGDH